MKNDTISAIATPKGRGGIGIVRISGPLSLSILQGIFSFAKGGDCNGDKQNNNKIEARRLHHGYVVDKVNRLVHDEALVSFMPGPHSYTREDVVEIQCHGSRVALENILRLTFEKGARMADPGEFTQRAFLNGRIDLTQAEAVADIINAETTQAAELALKNLRGGFKRIVASHLAYLKNQLVQIQAGIDFPEDVEDVYDLKNFQDRLNLKLIPETQKILEDHKAGQLFRQGVCLALVGKPNVGKSSLLNRIVQEDRAIVTDFPGTTRDVVEASIYISGISVVIKDTAGICQTDNLLDKLGVEKSLECLQSADLLLFIVDGSQKIDSDDRQIWQTVKEKDLVVVANKQDLNQQRQICNNEERWLDDAIWVSAKTGEGVDSLKKVVTERFYKKFGANSCCEFTTNPRQYQLLKAYFNCLERCLDTCSNYNQEEVVAEDLKQAMQTLQKINGEYVDSDVLDDIFKQFCIGK